MAKEFAQIILGGNTAGERPWQMTFNYKITTPASPDEGTLVALIGAWLDTGLTTFLAILPSKCSFVTISARSPSPPGYWPQEIGAGPIPGTRGVGEVLPAGVAPLVLIRGSFPVENQRAYTRIYLPAMLESDQEDGAINDEYVEKIKEFIEDIDNLSDSPLEAELGTYSKKHGVFFPSAGFAVSDKIARVRRRGRAYQGRASD